MIAKLKKLVKQLLDEDLKLFSVKKIFIKNLDNEEFSNIRLDPTLSNYITIENVIDFLSEAQETFLLFIQHDKPLSNLSVNYLACLYVLNHQLSECADYANDWSLDYWQGGAKNMHLVGELKKDHQEKIKALLKANEPAKKLIKLRELVPGQLFYFKNDLNKNKELCYMLKDNDFIVNMKTGSQIHLVGKMLEDEVVLAKVHFSKAEMKG